MKYEEVILLLGSYVATLNLIVDWELFASILDLFNSKTGSKIQIHKSKKKKNIFLCYNHRLAKSYHSVFLSLSTEDKSKGEIMICMCVYAFVMNKTLG